MERKDARKELYELMEIDGTPRYLYQYEDRTFNCP